MATFADKPTIVGDDVTLRPMRASDARSMWADVHDDEANRLTGTQAEFTFEQVERWCASRSAQPDRLDLAIEETSTGTWCGEVVISDWDADNRSCGFRIALSASARDRGIGTEATRLVVDYVFDEISDPPVNRVALDVFAFNPRAISVYEKVGFVREGRLRDALRWGGEFHDAIVMSMLRSDHLRSRP